MQNNPNISTADRLMFQSYLLAEQIFGSFLFNKISFLKRSFLKRITYKLSSSSIPENVFVNSISNLSETEFQKEYVAKSRPVIFKAAARDWVCCQKWDLDYFKLGYGEEDLLLVNANGLTGRENHSHYEILTLRELVENIKAGGDKYLRFSPLLENNPALVSDLNMNWLQGMKGKKTFANTYYMFMGGAGQKTLLHTDQPCNLSVQAYGEKKWTLYSPKDSLLMYPEISNTAYIKSPVDVDAPDFDNYPLFKYATAHIAHLEPGDVMYIPPHTWHFVENLTDTIAIGFRYSSLQSSLKSSITLTLLRVLSTNPPIWKTMKYGKIDTNLIWAHAGGKIKELISELELRTKRKNH
ncbi:MAG: cupin-like domain-containing protein [Bacteriovorax sp.]|jgi:hypothetical protein